MKPTAQKILSLNQAIAWATSCQNQGLEIVFSNGCFDILHLGHIDYLEKAAALGDRLIVALNTDASVKRLKGESRPINDEWARSRMMAALAFVDAVILFDEDTPFDLISALKPDILVKGSDYAIENIVGADFVINQGGRVETIALVEGFSTTGLINKLKK
jgi:rfaE bifunctional protein nucleotidyltransferase chain/domain